MCIWQKIKKSLLILLFSLFLLLFMGSTVLFVTIYEFYYTISVNFYLYLQYFQQNNHIPNRPLGSIVAKKSGEIRYRVELHVWECRVSGSLNHWSVFTLVIFLQGLSLHGQILPLAWFWLCLYVHYLIILECVLITTLSRNLTNSLKLISKL